MTKPTHNDADHADGHDPHLAHHYDTRAQQYTSGKLGMWIFLATEVLMFGGLFCAYSVYRGLHPEIFVYAHQFLDKWLGGINTVILICSSLSMAWAVRAIQMNNPRLCKILLALTLVGGFCFLGIKYVEYKQKWEHGLLWGKYYQPHAPDAKLKPQVEEVNPTPLPEGTVGMAAPATTPVGAAQSDNPNLNTPDAPLIQPAAVGPAGTVAEDVQVPKPHQSEPAKVQLFFSVYFLMTGLHGIHVIVGLGLIGWILIRTARNEFSSAYFTPVDFVGLYWHLVDLIWIFLFPLFYLIH